MKRGDIVTVVVAGEYGKPRPAVVVQSELLSEVVGSVLVCLFSSYSENMPHFRVQVQPSPQNGLLRPSQIMTDKVMAVSQTKIGSVIGRLEPDALLKLNRTLAFVLGLGH